jgi:lysozyme
MTVTPADWATALIQRFEELSLSPVPDTGDRYQLGFGMNYLPGNIPVTRDTAPITLDEAEALFVARLAEIAAQTDALVTVPLKDCERGALYSFVWNLGIGALGESTLLRLILSGDLVGASAEFPRWVHAAGVVLPGLVLRRAVEREVFDGLITIAQVAGWVPG